MPAVTSSLTVACQATVAVTFAASAVGKLNGRQAYAAFRSWLSTAAGIPSHLAGHAAVAVVVAEVATAAVMVVPRLVPAGFALAALLLAAFTVGVVSMVRRRVRTPCRCFGSGRRPPGAWHVARNVTLLAVATAGGGMSLAGTEPPAAVPEIVLAAVAGTTVALLLINVEEVVGLTRPALPGGRRP